MARYRIVPGSSFVEVEGRSTLHPIRFEASGLEGEIEVELEGGRLRPGAPVAARVELAAARLKTGNSLYDGELVRRLEIARHPRIVGEAVAAEPLADGRVRVRGFLTLRGRRNDVQGEVVLDARDGRTLTAEGWSEIDMRDFGLEPPRLFVLRVQPQVRLRGRVVAERVDDRSSEG